MLVCSEFSFLANYFSYSWHRFSQQENLPITHKDSKYVGASEKGQSIDWLTGNWFIVDQSPMFWHIVLTTPQEKTSIF